MFWTWYGFSGTFYSQKALRGLEGFKRQDEAEAKMKRMLDDGGGSAARMRVVSAAASEGQRRSMYNKNNRFLVTWRIRFFYRGRYMNISNKETFPYGRNFYVAYLESCNIKVRQLPFSH